MQYKAQCSSIPALRPGGGDWLTSAVGEADCLEQAFAAKCHLPPSSVNEYTELGPPASSSARSSVVRLRSARNELKRLRVDSGTGPDGLSTRVLKKCAHELGLPFAKLARRIVLTGAWPACWTFHWVVPLYKKKSPFEAGNYRGVHLTAQLSKATERLLGQLFLPALSSSAGFGPSQFA